MTLTKVHKFKLKGTGPIEFLLGCDYFCDEDGTLCSAPKKYIAHMESTYERLFGEKPTHRSSPLDSNDHPELLDTTSLLGTGDIEIYQSLVGVVQWVVSLGRFGIAVHVRHSPVSERRTQGRTLGKVEEGMQLSIQDETWNDSLQDCDARDE